jgi:hypothetical protein
MTGMKYFAYILFLLSVSFTKLFGQANDETGNNSGTLYLKIKSLSFIKNNEYFNGIGGSDFVLSSSLPWMVDNSVWLEGYTLTGSFFQPELVYEPVKGVSLRAGAHFLKYSGMDKISRIRPVFSTSLELTDNTTLTIGSLNGSDKHKMFDPHFNSERFYTNYVEDGFQVSTITDRIFNDTWLSWENYIFKGDHEREIFTFGESFRYTAPHTGALSMEIPVQIQFKHFGGQISNYPERVTTFFNLAAGGGLYYDLDVTGKIRTGFEYVYFRNSLIPARPDYILNKGDASWVKFLLNYKKSGLMLSYWSANDFYAPNGNSIYASVTEFYSGYVIHSREILTASIFLNVFPKNIINLLFGADGYYDIRNERFDYSMTLHLNFEDIFRIAKINHRE